MQAADNIIVCREVHKWFGEFHALRGVTLSVARGEVVGIIGPSGSGKSTFIRVLNRMEPHQRGYVRVNGTVLNDDTRDIDRVRRDVGMVFQSFNLFSHFTVLDNVSLAPERVLKLRRSDARCRALEALEAFGVASHADKYPDELSGGEQQRVAIARALAMRPSVMLLDEPTSALDVEMVREVLESIRSLAASEITVLLITHELDFIREVAGRLLVFDQGLVVEDRSPQEVLESPRNERTRRFLSRVMGRRGDSPPPPLPVVPGGRPFVGQLARPGRSER